MNNGRGDSPLFQRWGELYKDALFEADRHKVPRRIELAKHAILDRLEDANCARNKRSVQTGELAALRNAHRSLRVLEQIYFDGNSDKGNSGKMDALRVNAGRAPACV